ncbi:MOSC domain-containing protein [Cumulibacter manganitolerans]|uniref:MOSC domain-containing protein n=1 Tax=Cumulibacter manganitolerans TaxID=1884992 RepID=UPI001295201D|nr:MOSC N-terminal beta barrel domain-containing protein [Cumulibacter manganitolerans]
MTVTVSRLFCYPLKSGRRVELDAAQIVADGIAGDREYMVVDGDGVLVSQREAPALALLEPAEVIAACEATGDLRPVRVFGWQGLGEDQGETVARIVGARLERDVRVVRFPRNHRRATGVGGGQTMYADGYPLLVASSASLAELNRWLDEPVPMERFRPSIVLDGLDAPFVEDDIASITIGAVSIDLVKLSGRCLMTTIDQDTARKGREPLQTLGRRRVLPQLGGGREIMFAVNAIPRTAGTISVGDEVQVTMHDLPYEQRVAGG